MPQHQPENRAHSGGRNLGNDADPTLGSEPVPLPDVGCPAKRCRHPVLGAVSGTQFLRRSTETPYCAMEEMTWTAY